MFGRTSEITTLRRVAPDAMAAVTNSIRITSIVAVRATMANDGQNSSPITRIRLGIDGPISDTSVRITSAPGIARRQVTV